MSTVPLPAGRRRASWLLWAVLPLLGAIYQVAAEMTARGLTDLHPGLRGLTRLLMLPSVLVLVVVEVASFIAWMVVLAEFALGEAFTISAVSYVLVILVSWTVFHEPASLLQVAGGAAILAGVWLIGRPGAGAC